MAKKKKWIEGELGRDDRKVIFLPLIESKYLKWYDEYKSWCVFHPDVFHIKLPACFKWMGSYAVTEWKDYKKIYDTPWLKPGTKFLVDLEV